MADEDAEKLRRFIDVASQYISKARDPFRRRTAIYWHSYLQTLQSFTMPGHLVKDESVAQKHRKGASVRGQPDTV